MDLVGEGAVRPGQQSRTGARFAGEALDGGGHGAGGGGGVAWKVAMVSRWCPSVRSARQACSSIQEDARPSGPVGEFGESGTATAQGISIIEMFLRHTRGGR
jgi:hypothetical protein